MSVTAFLGIAGAPRRRLGGPRSRRCTAAMRWCCFVGSPDISGHWRIDRREDRARDADVPVTHGASTRAGTVFYTVLLRW